MDDSDAKIGLVPFGMTASEVKDIYLKLTMKIPRPPPPPMRAISGCDDFRAYLRFDRSVKETPPAASAAPPQIIFERVYDKYRRSLLQVDPPFTPEELPNDALLQYNGTPVAFRLAETVIEDFGPKLDKCHGNINWVDVACEMGRPFGIDPEFAMRLYHNYHHFVGPLVVLWLSDLKEYRSKLEIADFYPALIHDSRSAPSETPDSIMAHLDSALRALNFKLGFVIDEVKFDILRQSNSPLPGTEYIKILAASETPKFREIARLLPSHLACLLMDVLQWVLDRQVTEPSQMRLKIIKLFQDLVNNSDRLPRTLYRDGYVADTPISRINGGEAHVEFGRLGDRPVAVRVLRIDLAGDASSWAIERRYKRSIIAQRQFRHENLVDIIGVCESSRERLPSLIMPRMAHALIDHTFHSKPEPHVDMIAGIVRGLQHLHVHDFPHGDVHWKNILLDEHDTPKLADFGISRIDHREGNSTSGQPLVSGYLAFMPPEIRANESQTQSANPRQQYLNLPVAGHGVTAPARTHVRPDSSTDVFSCGIVLLAIALPSVNAPLSSGRARLEEAVGRLAKSQTGYGNGHASTIKRPPVLNGVPNWLGSAIWDLVLQMTRYEKSERISMDQVAVELERIIKTGAEGFIPVDYGPMDQDEEASDPAPGSSSLPSVEHTPAPQAGPAHSSHRTEAEMICRRYTEPDDEDVHPYISEILDSIQRGVIEDEKFGKEDRLDIIRGVSITMFNMDDQGGMFYLNVISRIHSPTSENSVDVHFTFQHKIRNGTIASCSYALGMRANHGAVPPMTSFPKGKKTVKGMHKGPGWRQFAWYEQAPAGSRTSGPPKGMTAVTRSSLVAIKDALFPAWNLPTQRSVGTDFTLRQVALLILTSVGINFRIARRAGEEDGYQTFGSAATLDALRLPGSGIDPAHIRRVCGMDNV